MEIFPKVTGKARDQAADLTGENPHFVNDTKRLKQAAPQMFDRVVNGTVSLPEPVQGVVLQKIEGGEARTIKKARHQVKDAALAQAMVNSPPDVDKYLRLVGPSLGHSRKPDDVYDIAEVPLCPYLELFAHRTRPEWTVSGNEIEEDE